MTACREPGAMPSRFCESMRSALATPTVPTATASDGPADGWRRRRRTAPPSDPTHATPHFPLTLSAPWV